MSTVFSGKGKPRRLSVGEEAGCPVEIFWIFDVVGGEKAKIAVAGGLQSPDKVDFACPFSGGLEEASPFIAPGNGSPIEPKADGIS